MKILNNVTPDNAVERLLEEAKRIHYEQTDKLKKVADESWKPYNKLLPLPKASSYKYGDDVYFCLDYPHYAFSYKPWGSSGYEFIKTIQEIDKRKLVVLEQLDKYINDCQDVYNKNIPLLEENKKIVEKLTIVMKAIGIPDSYIHSYYKTNNSRNKTTENRSAGYLCDIARYIMTTQSAVPEKKNILAKIEEAYYKAVHAAGEQARQAEKKRLETLKQNEMAMLRVKYTPEDAESRIYDIMQSILEKNKYLRLAHYLRLNREDWSEGYSFAEAGISGFEVITEDDELIYNEITRLISDWDGDGRCFRDCGWNYDTLFGMVGDEALLKDYEMAYKHSEY